MLPLGRRDRTLIEQLHHTDSSTPGSGGRDAGPTQRPARAITLWATPVLRVPRSFLDPRTAGSRNRAMGYQKIPAFQTGNAVTEPDVPPS